MNGDKTRTVGGHIVELKSTTKPDSLPTITLFDGPNNVILHMQTHDQAEGLMRALVGVVRFEVE